jgi:hypothetical protein
MDQSSNKIHLDHRFPLEKVTPVIKRGLNAGIFHGLIKGDAGNRDRLERFYSRTSVPTPYWLAKLDLQHLRST